MSRLPTTCPDPDCHEPGVTYSTGVIHHVTPLKVIAYLVLRCDRCDSDFFALPPHNTWQRCYANRLIVFTKNPQEIDVNSKLHFRLRNVGSGGWYLISPASQV